MKQYKIEITPIGLGGFEHNLICWMCNKEPAVYDANPNWHFIPCWKCQKKYIGIWTRKTFIDKLKLLFK